MIKKIITALFALSLSAGAAAAQGSCGSYPNTLTNGQPADANQVMADFEFVRTCVNNKLGRELLTGPRTYYVRNDGNDSNNCLANTPAGACATIQHAIDLAAAVDLGINSITISVADGTYAPITLKSYIGVGPITIQGNVGTPANVLISATNAMAVTGFGVSGLWQIIGVKLQANTAGYHCIFALYGTLLNYGH